MPYFFNNRGVSHLSLSIGVSETEIRIPFQDFDQFTKVGAEDGDTMFAILRDPIDREIIEIDLANSFDGQSDKYLKVNRAQGGTSAQAWPAGTLLFISTHSDHYESLFQPDSTRQIDFNPNGVLSPDYRGEKVFQFAGCQIRWWMSFDAVNPYWHLIAGEPCDDEEFVDPGFGFKVWFATALVCWTPHFDDTNWAPFSGNPIFGIWDGTYWNAANNLFLDTIGTWNTEITPPKWVRVSRPVDTLTSLFRLFDEDGGLLVQESSIIIGPAGLEIELNNPLNKGPGQIFMAGKEPGNPNVQMSNLEFWDCQLVEVAETGDIASVKRNDDVSAGWPSIRDNATGELIETVNVWVTTVYQDLIVDQYEIARTHIWFDLSAVTITELLHAYFNIDQNAEISGGEIWSWILLESTKSPPLTLADYQNGYTGVALADAVPFENGTKRIELNEDGRDLIMTKVGTANLLGLAMIEQSHDFANSAPVNSPPSGGFGRFSNASLELWGD